jgi:predicted phosphodiesterase
MEIANPKILSDPRWLFSVVSMVKRAIRGKAEFVDRRAEATLAESARVILFGDWGSGLPRARRIADRIKEELNDSEAARRQKHVIHLGDVYYGGEENEYAENFLEPWPVADISTGVASYTLNGNHDMYAGGQAYYCKALKDPRFAAQQGTSMFILANEHWQFLGLDTSYEDGGLYGEQSEWIRRSRREHSKRKTVLLSHHQLFSAYQPGAVTLRQKVRGLLEEQEIDAWFWGHEHRCLAYRNHERVRFASCVGHGGVPEYLAKKPAVPSPGLEYEYRKPYGKSWQPWITFGFAVLDVDGPNIHVRYIDEDGNEHWCTDLS